MPTTDTNEYRPPDGPFGDWLKAERESRGWTQASLAERVGCSEIMIRAIEAGSRQPSVQLGGLLLGACGVPTDQYPAYLAWARGGPAPIRETGPEPVIREAVSAAVAAQAAEDARQLERAVARALRRHRLDTDERGQPVAPPIPEAVLKEIVTDALQDYTRNRLEDRLGLIIADGVARALAVEAARVAEEARERARARWMARWYRVHVKEQFAAVALGALLLRGLPLPLPEVLLWGLAGVFLWASLAIWRVWLPVGGWAAYWRAGREYLAQDLVRTFAVPAVVLWFLGTFRPI